MSVKDQPVVNTISQYENLRTISVGWLLYLNSKLLDNLPQFLFSVHLHTTSISYYIQQSNLFCISNLFLTSKTMSSVYNK